MTFDGRVVLLTSLSVRVEFVDAPCINEFVTISSALRVISLWASGTAEVRLGVIISGFNCVVTGRPSRNKLSRGRVSCERLSTVEVSRLESSTASLHNYRHQTTSHCYSN